MIQPVCVATCRLRVACVWNTRMLCWLYPPLLRRSTPDRSPALPGRVVRCWSSESRNPNSLPFRFICMWPTLGLYGPTPGCSHMQAVRGLPFHFRFIQWLTFSCLKMVCSKLERYGEGVGHIQQATCRLGCTWPALPRHRDPLEEDRGREGGREGGRHVSRVPRVPRRRHTLPIHSVADVTLFEKCFIRSWKGMVKRWSVECSPRAFHVEQWLQRCDATQRVRRGNQRALSSCHGPDSPARSRGSGDSNTVWCLYCLEC
jgi:hypothetical protein